MRASGPIQRSTIEGKQPVGRGMLLVSATSVVFIVSGYVVHVWLGRLLGPAEYGLFGVVIALVTVLNVIQSSAIPQAVARYVAQFPGAAASNLRRGAELQLVLGLGLAACMALSAPIIAFALGDQRLTGLVRIAALILPSYALFALFMAFHNGRRAYYRQALTMAAYAGAKAVGAIGLAYAARVPGALIGYVIAPCVGAAVGWYRLSKATESPISYRRFLLYAGPLVLFGLASMGQLSVDLFLVKALIVEAEAAGYYTASQNIARIPYFLMNGLVVILLPAVAAAIRRGHGGLQRTTQSAFRVALMTVLPAVALLVATSEQVVVLLYTASYRDAAAAITLLGPAMGALALAAVAASVLNGLGRPGLSAILSSAGLMLTVVLCLVFIPSLGVVGAALATLCGAITTMIGSVLMVGRFVAHGIPALSAARSLVCATAVGLIAHVLPLANLTLVLSYGGLFVLYAGMLVLVGELRREDGRRLMAAIGISRGVPSPS